MFLKKFQTSFMATGLFVAAIKLVAVIEAAQVSLGIEHDMSGPTYGLQGPSSSQLTYDDKNGLNLKGTLNDIFGPPIKIANGFANMLQGSNMAGVGNSLKSGGAMLGLDAKLLEAAGGANLVKGGLLYGGAVGKTGLATVLGGLPGKKISSIIEMPVKVVAMKDIVGGKTLMGIGKMKESEAASAQSKGSNMVKEGEALKAQGMNQVVQGATEGMTNIGNMVQQTAGNAISAVKFLPIILDMPTNNQQQKQEQQVEQQTKSQPHALQQSSAGALTGGSMFGGLTSLISGLTANDPLLGSNQGIRSPFNLFGGQNNMSPNNGYVAIMNSTHPLTNLLMNPSMNPLLYPLATGPLGQSLLGKQPGSSSLLGQQSNFNYNLFPGIKMSETSSSNFNNQLQQHSQHQQHHQSDAQTTKV